MRILHVCHDYWPAVGGSELLLKEVSERLAGWGEEVRVFTSNASSTEAFVNPALPLLPPGKETIGGVPVRRFPISRRFRRPFNLVMQTAWRLRLPLNDLVRTAWNGPTSLRMIYEIARAKPDLVAATAFPFQTMYYPFLARLLHPFPIVLIPCFHPADLWSFDRPIMEKALRAADAIIALTEYERDHLLSMGVPEQRLHVLGAGTNPESFQGIDRSAFRQRRGIGGADPIVAFVGRMEAEKGIDTLLRAMPGVWREAPSARLVLAGPPTYYSPAIAAKIATLSPEDQKKIMLLGVITEEEKREMLVACDLLALPSRVESFGIVYLEAWACGKPVIGCRTGAVSSLIEDGKDGLLVTYGDTDGLADAIGRLVSDESMRREMGEKGRAKVADRYTWDRIAEQTRALYSRLIADSRCAPHPSLSPADKGESKRAPQPFLSPSGGEDKGEGAAVRRTQQSEARPRPVVSVVIVSYNSRQDVPECLGSLQGSTYPDIEVIVTDNGSTDGSVEFIRQAFPSVKVIELGKNLGFAEATNRAMRVARGRYLFQVNPDTRIDSRCIEELVRAMEGDETIGIAAAKMRIYFEPDVLNSTGIAANEILYGWDRGAFELDRGQYDAPTEIIAGCGGALMVRRSLIERIGELDGRFFMYYEDLDFGIRAWLSGARVVFIPPAIVHHKYKAGSRKALYNEYYDHRNRLRTIVKNLSLTTLAWMLPASLTFNAKMIARYLIAGRFRDAAYQGLAILWNLWVLPDTLRERKKVQRLRAVADATVLGLLTEGKGYPKLSTAVPTNGVAYAQSLAPDHLDSFVEMGRNDARQLGLGWHPRERWGDRVVRWTSEYGIAFLQRPRAGSPEILIQLDCYSPSGAGGSVLINDEPIGEYKVSPGSWTDIRIRAKVESELIKLTVLPFSTVVPQEQSWGDDPRRLGIAIASIRATATLDGSAMEGLDAAKEPTAGKGISFLEKITSPAMFNRLQELCQERPDVRTILYMLNHPKVLEWVHSVGVCSDERLRSLAPPVPHLELRKIVAHHELEIFLWTGLVDLERIITLYEFHKSHTDPACPRILDFGCGCGRMTRFLNDGGTLWSVFACDVNDALVGWCQKSLDGIHTSRNTWLPPLQYHEEMFNLVYGLSVFSHLPEERIDRWLEEFHRVLAPKGILIVTTHGIPALETIKNSEMHQKMFAMNRKEVARILEHFQAEPFVFRNYDEGTLHLAKAGADYGNGFIHPDYIDTHWNNEKFTVLTHLPGGLRGWQDIVVLQRK